MNDKVLNIILEYINNKNDETAIMINGVWGSGKTFFIKNILGNSLNNLIYVSLYGIANIDEIDEKICYEIIKNKYFKKKNNVVINLFSKIVNSIKKVIYLITNNQLKSKLGIDLSVLKKKDYVGIINQTSKLNNYVLVFDDLERCTININIVLGFINDLVEHKHVKTIIVTNDTEVSNNLIDNKEELKVLSVLNNKIEFPTIEKNQDILGYTYDNEKSEDKLTVNDVKSRISYLYSDNEQYKKIKEKLISKTINYEPDLNSVIDVYKKNYSNEISKHLENDLIIAVMNKNNCKNLRTLKVALNNFESIYFKTQDFLFKNYSDEISTVYHDILINTLYVTIAYKRGKYIPKVLNGSLYAYTSIEKDTLLSGKEFRAFSFVNDYISSAHFDNENMIKSIDYYFDVNAATYSESDPLYKLDSYWECESEELINSLEELKKKVFKDKYSYKLYPKIIEKLIALLFIDFETDLINEIINQMKKNINGKDVGYIDFNIFTGENNAKQKYDLIVEEFQLIISKNNDTKYKTTIDMILESENWGIELYKYAIDEYYRFINEGGFLARFNVKKLIKNIETSNNKNIHEFRRAIYAVYRSDNLSDYYRIDLPNIRILIDYLENLKDRYDKIKNMAISCLLEDLKTKLSYV